MYEVPDKGTVKSEILHHLTVAKHSYDSKNARAEVIQCGLHKQKTTWQRLITSVFA